MTHEEYTKAIQKQQSLIKRLFVAKTKRSKQIDDIVQERYGDLVGKFFMANKKFQCASVGNYYYITKVISDIGYTLDTKVEIQLICRTFWPTLLGCEPNTKTVGISYETHIFDFDSSDDITKILEPLMVTKEKAMEEFDKIVNETKENFIDIQKK